MSPAPSDAPALAKTDAPPPIRTLALTAILGPGGATAVHASHPGE